MRNFFQILEIRDHGNLMTRDDLRERLCSHSPDKHYVYVIWRCDKPHCEPMYVGKGKGRRVFNHFYAKDRTNLLKKAICDKMRRKGFEPIYSLIGVEMTDEEAMELETSAIRKVGRIIERKGPLTNFTEGGEGSAVTRKRGANHGRARAVVAGGVRFEMMSQAANALNISLSNIHLRISTGWQGYYYVDEGQRSRSKPPKGSPEHISRMRAACRNSAQKVSVDGIMFKSLSAAATHLGVSYATVRNRCRSGYYGYSFVN